MFIVSKLLALALEPLFWTLLLLLGGLIALTRRPLLGRRLAWASLWLLLLSGWVAVPNTLLHALETHYPPPADGTDLRQFVGLVVLGGGLSDSSLWTSHKQMALNDQAERMTMAVSLAQQHGHLQLLFSGGIASLGGGGLTEAQRAKIFFDAMGVAPSRTLYEAASRTTFENAANSARLAGVDPHQRWLLLTSAFHMPRAMGVFQRAGWNVTPYPVDYRTAGDPSWLAYSLHDGPQRWQLALHEWVGFYAYRIAGMI